jgi:hypothetical protein
LPPGILNDWNARIEILKHARKLRWIGRADEADKLLRTVWQNDEVRAPSTNNTHSPQGSKNLGGPQI